MRLLSVVSISMLAVCLAGCSPPKGIAGIRKGGEPSSRPLPIIPPNELNKDWSTRDAILGISADWTKDDIVHFEAVTLAQLDELVQMNFIDLDDHQNEAPSVRDIRDFMRRHEGALALGYAVNPSRADYRVTLEGFYIPKGKITAAAQAEARVLCVGADEQEFDSEIGCWWD